MKVKIDTKEKFHVITLQDPILTANMTEELNQMLHPYLGKKIRNIILKLNNVKEVDKNAAGMILSLYRTFYNDNASFVICEVRKEVEEIFKQLEVKAKLNFTPTESEAWDVVQMEEIEREFLD